MSKLFLLMTLLIGAFAVAGITWAQTLPTSIAVDISTAKLTWDHDNVSTVDEFNVDCGTVTAVVPAPTLELALKDFITTSGAYTCFVTAKNKFGVSGPSNKVTFEAGAKPTAPTGAAIVIQ